MIPTHRLPAESYEALCAGTPDTTGLSVLTAGQRSKHLLLLRLLIDRLPNSLLGPDTVVAQALDILDRLRRQQRLSFDRFVGYPYVGAGLVSSLRDLDAGGRVEPVVRFLAAAAAAAAVQAGQDFALDRVPGTDLLHLPGLGSARLDSRQDGVRLARQGERVMLGGVEILGSLRADRPSWWAVRPLGAEASGLFLDDLDPYRDTGGLTVAARVSPGRYAPWRRVFTLAWQRLRDRHPARAAEVARVLQVVTPLQVQRPGQGLSASSWRAYGAMAATFPADEVNLAATLVHETRHSVLNGLMDLVDFYDRDDRTLYYAPFRTDPRPLRALLHGCYAFLGVAAFWATERAIGPGSRRADFEFARALLQVRQALDTLAASTALTADGRYLVERMARHAEQLGSTPPDPVHHLAMLASDDHRISWRLRNVIPDRGLVEVAAEAWRAGRPTPALPDAFRLAQTAETVVPTERAHAWAQLAHGKADASGADRVLADGDYPAATRRYIEALRADPDDLAAWSGLALAGARLGGPGARLWDRRPELVRAVYLALNVTADPPPDPLALAGWLAPGVAG